MLGFISGLFVGACAGFICAALLSAGKDNDRVIEGKAYRCSINAGPCQDTCCRDCQGQLECKYVCHGNPESCGNSKEIEA
jgi:hypothetical protein